MYYLSQYRASIIKGITMKKCIFLIALTSILIISCISPIVKNDENGTITKFNSNKYDHSIGINLFAAQTDYAEDRLFADVMKMSRKWTAIDSNGNGADVAIDTMGWPTTDAECIVWHRIFEMNGTYHLEGDSKAKPEIYTGYGGADAVINNFTFESGHFSADIEYPSTGNNGLLLGFRKTDGGVRNVKLMRPVTPGSTNSYSLSTTFTDQVKKMVEPFSVIRYMWTVDGWNGAWQIEWSDRVQPDYSSYQRNNRAVINGTTIGFAGTGMPWEEAVRFSNETKTDMWINMPIGANDDYIRQLATLIKNTYTVPEGKIYWEYSNEATWDLSGICSAYLVKKGIEEAAIGSSIAFDGQKTDENILKCRYYIKRAAEMSLIWREVWGDAAMMTRVRPIASGQLSYNLQLVIGLDFLNEYYNNSGGNYVPTPHPVNYFFYGSGASHYTEDDPDKLVALDSSVADPVMVKQIDKFEMYEESEAAIAKMYGLKRCAYEGGVWTNKSDYLLPRINEAMLRYHALWDKYDNDVFMYYVSTGGEEDGTALGFTQSAFDLDTPKYGALNTILSNPKAAVTAGKVAPCTIEAADFSVSETPWAAPAPAHAETSGDVELTTPWHRYKGYLFRTSTDGKFNINLTYTETKDALIEIMVDGKVIAHESMTGTTSPVYSVQLTKGLHGIRIKRSNEGYLKLKSIVIAQ